MGSRASCYPMGNNKNRVALISFEQLPGHYVLRVASLRAWVPALDQSPQDKRSGQGVRDGAAAAGFAQAGVTQSSVSARGRREAPRAACWAGLCGAGLCFVQKQERSGAPRTEGRH